MNKEALLKVIEAGKVFGFLKRNLPHSVFTEGGELIEKNFMAYCLATTDWEDIFARRDENPFVWITFKNDIGEEEWHQQYIKWLYNHSFLKPWLVRGLTKYQKWGIGFWLNNTPGNFPLMASTHLRWWGEPELGRDENYFYLEAIKNGASVPIATIVSSLLRSFPRGELTKKIYEYCGPKLAFPSGVHCLFGSKASFKQIGNYITGNGFVWEQSEFNYSKFSGKRGISDCFSEGDTSFISLLLPHVEKKIGIFGPGMHVEKEIIPALISSIKELLDV